MGDDAALQLEGRIGRVVGGGRVLLALLVPARRDVGGAQARQALDFAEQVVEHVTPMADHIEDHAAAVFSAVVPRRALGFLPIAFEHPVAELAAYREHLAEEAGVTQHRKLLQTGQEQLVLHGAVLEPLALAFLMTSSAASRLVAIGFSQ